MERKLKYWLVDLPMKFESEEEAKRCAKNLRQFIVDTCNKKDDYMVQAIIGVSNKNGKLVCNEYNERIGKDKPRRNKTITDEKVLWLCERELYTDWHIHILVLSKPSETLSKIVKYYIKKTWYKNKQLDKLKVIEYNINIGYLFYVGKQSKYKFYVGSNDKRFDYSFKQLYNEKVKLDTAIMYEDSNTKINRLKNKYSIMIDYFNSLNEKQRNEDNIKHSKLQKSNHYTSY